MKNVTNIEIPSEIILKPTQIPLFENYPTISNDYIVRMIHSDRNATRYDIEKISRFFREYQNYGGEKIVNLESPLATMLIAYDNYKISNNSFLDCYKQLQSKYF